MGTINQPKPSQPGTPTSDPQPLQPGNVQDSRLNTANAERPNPESPEKTDRDQQRRT